MKKVSVCFLLIACVWLAFGYAATAATNPFAETDVQIQQSSADLEGNDEEAVLSNEVSVSKADIDKAIKKLEEANRNYSKLLRKFADDPAKFADENGDYRGFIKQLEELSRRLRELSDRLKKISADLDKGEEKEEKTAKIVQGTVKVNTSLNIRTSPWGTIIGSFYNNDKVKIVGQKGDWYKIDYNGRTAFIHANYVETGDKPAGKTPVKYPSQNDQPSTGNNVVAGKFGAAPCQPMPGRASSEFGWRIHPVQKTRKFHNGIDLPVPNGTRLNALGNGTVTAVGYESGGGKYIKVKYDNGYESFYCHLQGASVKKGQRVGAGQEIARSDNTGKWTTGPHLHFGLKKNGQYVNPRSANIPLP
jgi:murein DD-endopeptidase MepM/ murein hydrolase activator NlpD